MAKWLSFFAEWVQALQIALFGVTMNTDSVHSFFHPARSRDDAPDRRRKKPILIWFRL
jgi:hypothetical protein